MILLIRGFLVGSSPFPNSGVRLRGFAPSCPLAPNPSTPPIPAFQFCQESIVENGIEAPHAMLHCKATR
uniref:Uncharacterized protein n=1 Tax=Arundo donax TaxID=35708 RepID=A0A0A9DL31_ARUDO